MAAFVPSTGKRNPISSLTVLQKQYPIPRPMTFLAAATQTTATGTFSKAYPAWGAAKPAPFTLTANAPLTETRAPSSEAHAKQARALAKPAIPAAGAMPPAPQGVTEQVVINTNDVPLRHYNKKGTEWVFDPLVLFIDMSLCGLTQFPASLNAQHTHVHSLNLSGNLFTKVPEEIAAIPNIQVLNLSFNPLTNISCNTLNKMTHLRELIISKGDEGLLPKDLDYKKVTVILLPMARHPANFSN